MTSYQALINKIEAFYNSHLQVKKVGILRMKKWFCIPCNKYFNRPQKEDENTIKSLLEDMLCARTYRKDKFKS